MGRKKPSGSTSEEVAGDASVSLSKKSKKKGQLLPDDDEYMVVDQLDDDDSVKSGLGRGSSNAKEYVSPDAEADLANSFEQMGVSQKKKTKGKKSEPDPDDSGSQISVADDGAIKKRGKKGKKGMQIEDDEYDVASFDDAKSVQSIESSQSRKGGVQEEDAAPERLSSQVAAQVKKKNKKGKSSKKEKDDDDYELSVGDIDRNGHDIAGEDSDTAPSKPQKKPTLAAKPKKDALFALLGEMDGSGDAPEFENDSEVDNPGTEPGLSDEVLFSGKKKSGKMGKDAKTVMEELESLSRDVNDGSDDAIVFSGKKKAKGKKGSKSIEEDSEAVNSGSVEDNHEEPVHVSTIQAEDVEVDDSLVLSGKKKSKKGKEDKRAESKNLVLETDEFVDVLDAEDLPVFSGEKKGKNKKGSNLYLDEDMDGTSDIPDMGTAHPADASLHIENETESSAMVVDEDVIQFTGKKKGKKGKKSDIAEDADIETILADLDAPKLQKEPTPVLVEVDSHDVAPAPQSEDLLAASKKKSKKGKKSGRSAQEEEDLDAILAELDGPKPVKQPEVTSSDVHPAGVPSLDAALPVPLEAVNEVDVADTGESAAAKKKKKKKEKAKAVAGEKQVDQGEGEALEEKPEVPKTKVLDKKVPKHVREMQERLAKQKEAEERKKREEEEQRRKEEEEQRRLEELEREKEEIKRRRKEREKEKLLKKKQEGKLLTGKQKEEARRLALMREQLLAQKGHVDSDTVTKEDAAPKKPKYDNKKKRRPHGGESVPSMEHPVEEHEMLPAEESHMETEPTEEKEQEKEPAMEEILEAEVQVEEDVNEDWDAKSWDSEVELPAIKSTFAEEEDLVVRKASRQAVTQPLNDIPSAKRSAPPQKADENALSSAVPLVKSSVQESEDETESEDEIDTDEEDVETRRRREAAHKREARKAEALAKRSADDLRSPICCILGHVDTGKTKLLDCIRRTNVQEGEAGGITQQIGATYFPMENIQERTKELKSDASVRVPGLLVIDTPGHESFTNLRARGSGLCDIAILVIDIMHGLEPQTLESLNLLKMRHTPFVVALNKVDRLYNWKTLPNAPIKAALKQQSKDVVNEFEMRLSQIVTELKEQGMNSELYYKNKELRKFVSIVPTSAISGEGVPDLLMLLVHLTQKLMEEKLMFISEVQCTVLEVKVIEGLGTTIDVILVNGVLHEGAQIVVCGMQGPIVTNIRALLTPHPMKELRVKGSYQHHKELKAAQGIKITAQGLEHAIAGTQLYVVGSEDDLEVVKEEAMQDMKNVMSRVDKSGEGVCVQASTLGSLEALLEFLKSPAVKIPVSGINIGPVHKRDVMRASVMLERKKKEYATILAFDVKVTPEAKELAEELGVKIFMADIIYHLFDQFTAYMNNIKEEKRKEVSDEAVFPCVLSIKPQFIFNKKDPIILGVDVLEGIAKVGTPLCVPSKDMIDIGRIASMEVNHKVVDIAKKGQAVAMKIVGSNAEETQKMFGRHFDHEDELVSHITRSSIDVLKENFRDELSVEEWKLVVKLKKLFNIP